MSANVRREDGFQVAAWIDAFGGFIARHKPLWIRIGNLETKLLADELETIPIEQPIYIAGLARSGTTILLEILSQHQDVVTHRYKDYPPIFTPVFWNGLLERIPQRSIEPVERTHRDGIMVTPDSPEALEEPLWMAFFSGLHDPESSAVLDDRTANPAFELFYRNHIRKLLRVRSGRRYVSKGNYNLTRLEYLLKLFPDARFVVPIREPSSHIASLMKQHELFAKGQSRSPRALEHMRRVGHFEFGLDRRPINAGDRSCITKIAALWEQGNDVEAWSRYWNHIYGHVAERLDANLELRDAVVVVRFEDLCRSPREILRTILDHCRLSASDPLVDQLSETIRLPTYDRKPFTQEELRTVDRRTAATAERFGYEPSQPAEAIALSFTDASCPRPATNRHAR